MYGRRYKGWSQKGNARGGTADHTLLVFQVNEIYHDESLGAHINVVLVRIILLSHGKVSE